MNTTATAETVAVEAGINGIGPAMHTTPEPRAAGRHGGATLALIAARPPFRVPGGVFNVVPPRVVFGPGSLAEVGHEVAFYGAKRALILSTPGRGTLARRVADLLGSSCAGILPEAVSQVPIELARRGREHVRSLGADCLVSVGGGASIGLGKGIALEVPLPIIAIPTTYSGSEMTPFCGITEDGVKRRYMNLNMLAGTVIYDPELSLSLPLDVSAASGLNALAHCIDGIAVSTASPITALAAAEGARVLMDALPRLAADPDDLGARTDMLYGAYLGGAAITGGLALQHVMAHALGGSFDVPHGLAHALVLPHVTAYNQRVAGDALAPLVATIGDGNLGGAVFDILVSCSLPTSLQAVGFAREDLQPAAALTLQMDNGLNPAPVTPEAVQAILDAAYEGRRPG